MALPTSFLHCVLPAYSNSLLCVIQGQVRLARARCCSWKKLSYKWVEEIFPFRAFSFGPLSAVLLSGLTHVTNQRMSGFFLKRAQTGASAAAGHRNMSGLEGRERVRPCWRHGPQTLREMRSLLNNFPLLDAVTPWAARSGSKGQVH